MGPVRQHVWDQMTAQHITHRLTSIREYRDEVFKAHRQSAPRSLSGKVLVAAFDGNGMNYNAAVIAALATLGGKHGPIMQAQSLLEHTDRALSIAENMNKEGLKVPGWGSSFAKDGEQDPVWEGCHELLKVASPGLWETLNSITQHFKDVGKPLQPNAAAYTACLSILMGLPCSLAPSLFVEARAPAWREYLLKLLNK